MNEWRSLQESFSFHDIIRACNLIALATIFVLWWTWDRDDLQIKAERDGPDEVWKVIPRCTEYIIECAENKISSSQVQNKDNKSQPSNKKHKRNRWRGTCRGQEKHDPRLLSPITSPPSGGHLWMMMATKRTAIALITIIRIWWYRWSLFRWVLSIFSVLVND